MLEDKEFKAKRRGDRNLRAIKSLVLNRRNVAKVSLSQTAIRLAAHPGSPHSTKQHSVA